MKQNSKDKMRYNHMCPPCSHPSGILPEVSSQGPLLRGKHFYHFLSILSEKLHKYTSKCQQFFFFINGILVIYCCRENYPQTQWLTHFLSLFLWVTGIWEQLRWVVLARGLSWNCTQDLSEDWGQLKLDLGWKRPQNKWSERKKKIHCASPSFGNSFIGI